MASLKQMVRDKLESLRERRGGKKEREREKRAENQPIIEMASGKKRTGKHRLRIGRWQRERMKDGERTWRKEDVDVGSETGKWRG